MKRSIGNNFFIIVIFSICLSFSNNEDLSKTLGILLKDEIQNTHLDINLDKVAEGLLSKDLPPLSKEEYLSYLAKIRKEKEDQNLEIASNFLQANGSNANIFKVIENELHYEIIKEGAGEKIEKFDSPLLKICSYTLDHSPIFEQEMVIYVYELPSSFQTCLKDMREDEIRKIYAHPKHSFAPFGKGSLNSLTIYEITLIKSDKNKLFLTDDLVQKIR